MEKQANNGKIFCLPRTFQTCEPLKTVLLASGKGECVHRTKNLKSIVYKWQCTDALGSNQFIQNQMMMVHYWPFNSNSMGPVKLNIFIWISGYISKHSLTIPFSSINTNGGYISLILKHDLPGLNNKKNKFSNNKKSDAKHHGPDHLPHQFNFIKFFHLMINSWSNLVKSDPYSWGKWFV